MADLYTSDPFLHRIVRIIGVLALIIAGFYALDLVRSWLTPVLQVLSPFLAAFLLAYILSPVVSALQRRLRFGRLLGTLVVFVIIVLAALGVLAYLLPLILAQLKTLVMAVKEGIPEALAWLSEKDYIDKDTINQIRSRLNDLSLDYNRMIAPLLDALKRLASGGFAAVGELTAGLVGSIRFLFGSLFFLAFVIIITFYLILDWYRIRPFLENVIPHRWQDKTFSILTKIDKTVGGFLRGQLIVALLVGSSFAIGLFFAALLGFPALGKYSLLIGTMAGLGGFVPYLGSVVGVTPALLIVMFTQTPTWSAKIIALAAVLGLFTLIQAVEGWVLQPKIVGKGAGLHPLVVLLALVVGTRFGIGGIIIAIPAAGVIKVLAGELISAYASKKAP